MVVETEDTIAAVATPAGRAALGIVRISGKDCSEIVSRVFVPGRKKQIVAYRPMLGKILLAAGRYLDEALLTLYRKPHSYTREDLAEITCHGNPLILEEVLESLLASGARLARPGEFTYRAFLNGRIDLIQAEAVQDLISADSLYQAELALTQLDGRLSNRFQELKRKMVEVIALMEGNIDFSEEQHYQFIDQTNATRRLNEIIEDARALLGTFDRGRVIKEGFRIALVGKPNVGKSSVFNSILGQDRAIVTPVAGTTRDYLHERFTLGSYLIHLMDTAGIRDSEETVEKEGIKRSRQVIEKAELILFLLDGSLALGEEDFRLWEEIAGKDRLVVSNKSDLPGFINYSMGGQLGMAVSARTGAGLPEILKRIQAEVETKVRYSSHDSFLSSQRHREILKQSLAALERGSATVRSGVSEEFALIDLQEALRHLGEITGEVTVDDLYQHIFSNFCIGK
jgi:tRNA modification GTPase